MLFAFVCMYIHVYMGAFSPLTIPDAGNLLSEWNLILRCQIPFRSTSCGTGCECMFVEWVLLTAVSPRIAATEKVLHLVLVHPRSGGELELEGQVERAYDGSPRDKSLQDKSSTDIDGGVEWNR